MKTQSYKIKGIYHNGRKDIRMKPRDDFKYVVSVGRTIIFQESDLKQYEPFKWYFINHPFYETWTTSEVLEAFVSEDKNLVRIETANTIYEFEKIEN